MQTMNNGKSNMMKRTAIAAVCVGMIGSGGLVQAQKAKSSSKVPKKVEIARMIDVPASKIASLPVEVAVKSTTVPQNNSSKSPIYTQPSQDNFSIRLSDLSNNSKGFSFKYKEVKVNLPDFQIGQAEVTWALWSDVYNWATKKGYKFANKGTNVGTDKPVTGISWYDAIVWTNAYSEKSVKVPVYLGKNNKILKDATNGIAFNNMVVRVVRKDNGYRLLTETEWTIAARWGGTKKPTDPALAKLFTKGKDGKTYYWLPENHASGATKDVYNEKETARVAWFGQKSAQKICTKAKNVLNICDMSGSVWEWQLTSKDGIQNQGVRGGSWSSIAAETEVSYVYSRAPSYLNSDIGFRLARNVQ